MKKITTKEINKISQILLEGMTNEQKIYVTFQIVAKVLSGEQILEFTRQMKKEGLNFDRIINH